MQLSTPKILLWSCFGLLVGCSLLMSPTINESNDVLSKQHKLLKELRTLNDIIYTQYSLFGQEMLDGKVFEVFDDLIFQHPSDCHVIQAQKLPSFCQTKSHS